MFRIDNLFECLECLWVAGLHDPFIIDSDGYYERPLCVFDNEFECLRLKGGDYGYLFVDQLGDHLFSRCF